MLLAASNADHTRVILLCDADVEPGEGELSAARSQVLVLKRIVERSEPVKSRRRSHRRVGLTDRVTSVQCRALCSLISRRFRAVFTVCVWVHHA